MIVAREVSKYYGTRPAISDLNFTIEAGEVVGLLGLNGAGKTTTLRILSGLLVPTTGEVHIAGLDMAKEPEAVRARIGFLPETPPLYREMTVAAFVGWVAHIKGLRGNVEPQVKEALAATDLTEVADDRISTLSHGFQKRVGIAQAIVHQPALILLDEPTSGLDPVQVVHMRKLIKNLAGRHTVLVSSHVLSEIHQVCDRLFVLQAGRIVAEGSEAQLGQKLTGNTKVGIHVRGTQAEVEAAFAKVSSLAHHTIEPTDDEGILFATVELKEDRRDEVARAVVQAGLGLLGLEKMQLELESIFLELTGGKGPTPVVANPDVATVQEKSA